MTLTVTHPDDWTAVSNSLEQKLKVHEGRRVLERYNISNFLSFYADESKVAITSFE